MGRRSIVAVFSIFVHTIVLLAIMTADFWRPITEWPAPHRALAFEVVRPARLVDIELPKPAARQPAHAADDVVSPTVATTPIESAPTIEPSGMTRESGNETTITTSNRGVSDIERTGGSLIASIGPAVALPAPPVTPPVRVGGVIRAPQRIVNVTPNYPAIAREAHAQGLVIIEATIDERGNVVRARILKSIPLLDEAALAAVRQWKFTPTLLNGVAVPIVMTVTVNFALAP
jgi:protein TonB